MRKSPSAIKFKPAASGPSATSGYPLKIHRASDGQQLASITVAPNETPGADGKITVPIGTGPLRTPDGEAVYATVAAQNADGTSATIQSSEYTTEDVPEPPAVPESIEIVS